MYTTKLVNKNIVEGNKYITIGDEYKDPKLNIFREVKKTEKQQPPFLAKTYPKNGGDGYFAPTTYTPSAFKEALMYTQTQPLEKRMKGFGTRDASRRDEFTSSIRTEQYREMLRREKSRTPAPSLDELLQSESRLRASTAPAASENYSYRLSVTQYDIGRSQVTEFDPKATRDRYYKLATDREKVYGSYRPSSTDVGRDSWDIEYHPPSHGTAGEIKHFYDKSHIKLLG